MWSFEILSTLKKMFFLVGLTLLTMTENQTLNKVSQVKGKPGF